MSINNYITKDITHKVKVSILRNLPVVWEGVLGLNVVA